MSRLRTQICRPRTAPSLLVLAVSVVVGCKPTGGEPRVQGSELFNACVNCHGANAEGVQSFDAPALAGQPAWYLEAQLLKFRESHRGYNPDDLAGMRMRPMSRVLRTDQEIKQVVAHIAQLPKPTHLKRTLSNANLEAGKNAFAVCIACHGANGAGNEALKAPPLTGQHDWYVASQLKKFKSGLRGTRPGDATGAQMRPMAMTLPDDQAIENVSAYISTLSQ